MGIKVTQNSNDLETATNMRLLSLVVLGISIFFFLLFFVYWSANHTAGPLGSGDEGKRLYEYIIVITALTVAILAMHFYTSKSRVLSLLKYGLVIGNAVVIGLAINEMTKGYNDLFGSAPGDEANSATEYVYAGLGLGFAGLGTLLCFIHNFYGIYSTV